MIAYYICAEANYNLKNYKSAFNDITKSITYEPRRLDVCNIYKFKYMNITEVPLKIIMFSASLLKQQNSVELTTCIIFRQYSC